MGEYTGIVDLSHCTDLEEIYAKFSWIEYPDVSGLNKLQVISFGHCRPTGSIPDVSKYPDLRELWLDFPWGVNLVNTELLDFDFSNNPKLEILFLHGANVGNITGLSVATKLERFASGWNPYQRFEGTDYLDLTAWPELIELWMDSANIGELKSANNTKLDYINCRSNHLTTLNLSGCSALRTIDVSLNKLTALDLGGCPELNYIDVSDNNLAQLDLSAHPKVETIKAVRNKLTSLNTSNLAELGWFEISDNPLSGLDLSNNPKLWLLGAWSCGLTTLDVTHNPEMDHLSIGYNDLTSLDLTNLTKLNFLDCRGNRIATLNVSKNLFDPLHDPNGLWCSQQTDENGVNYLKTLYITEGQAIPYVTENRSDDHIPSTTTILVAPTTGGGEGFGGGDDNEP